MRVVCASHTTPSRTPSPYGSTLYTILVVCVLFTDTTNCRLITVAGEATRLSNLLCRFSPLILYTLALNPIVQL